MKRCSIVLSLDLDKTLLHWDKFSEICIQGMKLVKLYAIKCFVVTSRHIADSIQDALEQIERLQRSKPSLPYLKIGLKTCVDRLFFASCGNVLQRLSEEDLELPTIVTIFDPFIQNPGFYYQKIDQVMEYVAKRITQVEEGELEIETLKSQLKIMIELAAPKKKNNEVKAMCLNEIEQKAYKPIEELLIAESELRRQYKRNSLSFKDNQFHWIHTETGCDSIVHIDDYDKIYTHMGKKAWDDLRLIAHKVHSTNVYCIPYDSSASNHPQVLEALIRGLNLPIDKIISDLEKFHEPPCCCFFSARSGKNERETIARVIDYLQAVLIPDSKTRKREFTEIKGESEKICTSRNKSLHNIIARIPFDQIKKMEDQSVVTVFARLQKELMPDSESDSQNGYQLLISA